MSSNTNNQRINFASIKNPMKYPDFLEVQLHRLKTVRMTDCIRCLLRIFQ